MSAEPTHDGRTVTEWIDELDQRSLYRCEQALSALEHLAPHAMIAVPRLWKLAEHRNRDLRYRALSALYSIGCAVDIELARRARVPLERMLS